MTSRGSPVSDHGPGVVPFRQRGQRFLHHLAQSWAACADRQFTVPPEKPEDPEQRFQTTPLTNANGVLSLTLTGTVVGAGYQHPP